MIFGKFSRPFGRAMQIPEESGMQVRVKIVYIEESKYSKMLMALESAMMKISIK